MKKYINKIIIVLFLALINLNSHADIPYYLDFKYILNESAAGKKAQNQLKNILDTGIKEITKKEKSLQEEEKKLIEQKKLLKPEEYKARVNQLRQKVMSLQKERNKLFQETSKKRSNARSTLLKNLTKIC